MKSTFSFIACIMLFSFACRKERQCECVTSSSYTDSNGQVVVMNGGTSANTTTNVTTYKKVKKSDMKSLCGNSSYTSEEPYPDGKGGTATVTIVYATNCKLK